jgi:hypothetical protein
VLCLGMHSNVMLRFMVQVLQDLPLCSSTVYVPFNYVSEVTPNFALTFGQHGPTTESLDYVLLDQMTTPLDQVLLRTCTCSWPQSHDIIPLQLFCVSLTPWQTECQHTTGRQCLPRVSFLLLSVLFNSQHYLQNKENLQVLLFPLMLGILLVTAQISFFFPLLTNLDN